jgi:glucokinase
VSGRIIGVDVGGTKIAVAALEGDRLSEPDIEPTVTSSTDALLDQLVAMISRQGEAHAVGIAVPSVVDFATGTARFSVNIPLAGVPLRDVLGKRLHVPVFVDNDATCAALAESWADPDHVPQVLVMFTVGTGVGGGIVLNGRIFRGATGGAAELGHQIVSADLKQGAPPKPTEWPQPGSLEENADGDAMAALARERGFRDGKAAVEAAKTGDPKGIEAVRILGERLGVGIANAMHHLDPDMVVIGGGVSAAGDLLLKPAEDAARRLTLTGVGTSAQIRLARYGNNAGVRGAALLAATEVENEERISA